MEEQLCCCPVASLILLMALSSVAVTQQIFETCCSIGWGLIADSNCWSHPKNSAAWSFSLPRYWKTKQPADIHLSRTLVGDGSLELMVLCVNKYSSGQNYLTLKGWRPRVWIRPIEMLSVCAAAASRREKDQHSHWYNFTVRHIQQQSDVQSKRTAAPSKCTN